jgi:hypothetical protein
MIRPICSVITPASCTDGQQAKYRNTTSLYFPFARLGELTGQDGEDA